MAYSRNALSLLLNYDSDSERDSGYTSEEEKKRKANFINPRERKRKTAKLDDNESDITMDCSDVPNSSIISDVPDQSLALATRQRRIPLPAELCNRVPEVADDPNLHQGRIRSFPHERGNWASVLYIPLVFGIYEPHLKSLISALTASCQEHNITFVGMSEFHISLSRTLVLRLHWIQPLISDFRKRLTGFLKFSVWLFGLAIYSNEEKTRTFLGVKVCQGRNEMMDIVSLINESVREYKLPTFYEDCSFHVSLGWCNGNKAEELKKILPQLENICTQYFNVESDMRTFEVDELHFKTGNRIHRIPLTES